MQGHSGRCVGVGRRAGAGKAEGLWQHESTAVGFGF